MLMIQYSGLTGLRERVVVPSEDEFTIWVSRGPRRPGQLGASGATLKKGDQRGERVCKTVMLSDYGDPETGELSRRELRFRTYPRRPGGSGYDFNDRDPARTWHCENDEIERLLAFLHAEVDHTGRYRVIDAESPMATVIELLDSSNVSTADLASALANRGDLADVVRLLVSSGTGQFAAQQAVVGQRRALVRQLCEMAADHATTETHMQPLMGKEHWLFGGRYVGVAERRNLTVLDQHDIPLLCADGTLHIVELKGPRIENLVQRHRNHWIVGEAVHEAVSQAMNYLRSLDEQGNGLTTTYRNELGVSYDMRRVFATVVIGFHDHVRQPRDAPPVTAEVIEQTIRSYNAHLTRVEVVTYNTLLNDAERALNFEDTVLTNQLGDQRIVLPSQESAATAAKPGWAAAAGNTLPR